jgi:hypothetical protein
LAGTVAPRFNWLPKSEVLSGDVAHAVRRFALRPEDVLQRGAGAGGRFGFGDVGEQIGARVGNVRKEIVSNGLQPLRVDAHRANLCDNTGSVLA